MQGDSISHLHVLEEPNSACSVGVETLSPNIRTRRPHPITQKPSHKLPCLDRAYFSRPQNAHLFMDQREKTEVNVSALLAIYIRPYYLQPNLI